MSLRYIQKRSHVLSEQIVAQAEDHLFFGDSQSAEKMLMLAIEYNPFNAHAYHSLGVAVLGTDHEQESIKHFLKAIALYPANRFYISLMKAYDCLGKYENILEIYEKENLFTLNDPLIDIHLGLMHARLGDFEKAKAVQLKFKNITSRNPRMLSVSASIEVALFPHLEDVNCFGKAIESYVQMLSFKNEQLKRFDCRSKKLIIKSIANLFFMKTKLGVSDGNI